MQRITQFDGIYGEANGYPDGDYLFSELLETRSRTFDWVIQPHIHARLYQVFFVQTGEVQFQEATRQRQLTGPFVLLIPPTALHGFVYSADATGRILTLSDALVDSLFPKATSTTHVGESMAPMLASVQCLTDFDALISPATISQLIREIDTELFDSQPEKKAMLHACLQRLFLVLFRLWRHGEVVSTSPGTPGIRHFRSFQQLVRQVGTTHSIVQIADELAITPVHLNRICQAISGKSASQLIQAHILDEARKYLTYTSYSVSEIAYLLHFEYPNYFARFFRKHTGLSPTEFREGRQA
ncbi:helix-turn-helix domain-containing protein [Fibrella aquatica]|uniref:helix-turn-helix domain-containing protein n=1 Tax=Fibrella aquatica TaxID=3242487 RepID=UPI0035224B0C